MGFPGARQRRPLSDENLVVLALGIAVVAFVAVVLFDRYGPERRVDAEQMRLCRILIPALFPEGDGIRVLSADAGSGGTVHVAFRLDRNDPRDHLISCRFAGTGFAATKRDLAGVLVDGVALGESTFYLLRERWLESPHAAAADPGPPREPGDLFQLDRPTALALQHLIGGLPRLAILALLALATALIYGLLFRINLAFGEFAALGGIGAALTVIGAGRLAGDAVWLAAFAGILASAAIGALYGAVVGRHLLWPLGTAEAATRGAAHGQPLIVAGVGLMIVVQEGLRLAQGARTIWLPPVGGGAIAIAEAPGFVVTLTPRLVGMAAFDAVLIIGVLLVMARTRFGRAWRAMADDGLAASLMGIDPRRVLIGTSALATALAALAGANVVLNWGGMHFAGGTMLGLTALIAAILGGIGSPTGAVIGALAIGSFQIIWTALRPIEHWEFATFSLLTLALALMPGGIFGYADGASRKV